MDISSAQPISVAVVQSAERAYAPALRQRGSLPSSHVMIVGSSLYWTPVIVFVRLRTWAIQFLYHCLITGSV